MLLMKSILTFNLKVKWSRGPTVIVPSQHSHQECHWSKTLPLFSIVYVVSVNEKVEFHKRIFKKLISIVKSIVFHF